MKTEPTDEQILANYEKLSNKKKVDILTSAISYMKQYNGRSYEDCIILAMKEIF